MKPFSKGVADERLKAVYYCNVTMAKCTVDISAIGSLRIVHTRVSVIYSNTSLLWTTSCDCTHWKQIERAKPNIFLEAMNNDDPRNNYALTHHGYFYITYACFCRLCLLWQQLREHFMLLTQMSPLNMSLELKQQSCEEIRCLISVFRDVYKLASKQQSAAKSQLTDQYVKLPSCIQPEEISNAYTKY